MQRGDLRSFVLIRGGISTSSSYYTETDLNDLINQSHRWAAGYKKWPFTEGRSSTTWSSSTEEWNYPEGWKTDSIRFAQLGGKELRKINFKDYQFFREKRPDADDRVFSDFGRIYYVNPKVDSSGTLTVYGYYTPAEILDGDGNDTTETVFVGEDEGNEAVIEYTLGLVKLRAKKLNEAKLHFDTARNHLEELWFRVKEEQSQYQTHETRGGLFKRFEVLGGAVFDERIPEDQFY